jgi:hypothetical protein
MALLARRAEEGRTDFSKKSTAARLSGSSARSARGAEPRSNISPIRTDALAFGPESKTALSILMGEIPRVWLGAGGGSCRLYSIGRAQVRRLAPPFMICKFHSIQHPRISSLTGHNARLQCGLTSQSVR